MDLKHLNNKQQEAVIKIGGPILVFAGAGSGKTRVLTHKIGYLINEVGLPPKNILAVTFTNKAAQEMKLRILKLVSCDISGISIGTFHSVSAQLLRRNIDKLGYTNDFSIYDQQDSKAVIKQVIKELDLDIKQFEPRTFQIKISNAKNQMNMPEYYKFIDDSFMDEKFYQIYSRYQTILKDNNSVDFDDLLVLPNQLFDKFPKCLEYYQNKYKYVLVDEYQDTNKPQFDLIHSISQKHKDIFVVGDDDQSIYGWRGADISNILNFKEAFGEATIIKLEQNYRSTKNILDAAWSVVSKNLNRSKKRLWTDNEKGELINLIEAFDERDEAKKIVKLISKHTSELSQIAILYRTNSQSRSIEDELRKTGIPYQIIGGVKFYDRKEIKDIIAYLKIIVNPSDSVSFDRIINFPTRGLGKTTLEKIHNYATKNSLSNYKAIQSIDHLNISNKQKESINKFQKLIKKYMNQLKNEPASTIVKNLISDLGLENFYTNQATSESSDRWDNIKELISSVEEFDSQNDSSSLRGYLEEVSLLMDIDRWNNSNNLVTLMTVHSSKGLEFNNVFIAGLEDGLFPILRVLEENDIEEERRLFYVALTRSKKNVAISYAKTRRKFGSYATPTLKSRFIEDIPKELLKENRIVSTDNNYGLNQGNSHMKEDISTGTRVEHSVFGKGKILNIEGRGDNSKLTILFVNNMTKKLIFKYANLKIIN